MIAEITHNLRGNDQGVTGFNEAAFQTLSCEPVVKRLCPVVQYQNDDEVMR